MAVPATLSCGTDTAVPAAGWVMTGAAGALKTVKPDHRNAGFGLHRGSDILGAGAAEAEAGSGEGAELQEAPAAYTLTAKGLVLCFSHSYLL